MFTLANNFYKWVKKRQEKSLTIILLGLDNAGKSTLLYGLKNELPQSDITPTIGFRPSKLVSGKYTIQWFDVGGAKNFRRVWQNYYPEVHGIIYVVDGADLGRIEESRETLIKTLESEGIPGKPVLIFANKQDLPGCLNEAELSEKLGLLERKDCRYHVATCQAKPKDGEPVDSRITKGLRWLLDAINSNYNQLNTRVVRETEELKKKEKEKREEQKKRAEANKAARLKEQAEAEAAAGAAAQRGDHEPGQQEQDKQQQPSASKPPEMIVEGAASEGNRQGVRGEGSNRVAPASIAMDVETRTQASEGIMQTDVGGGMVAPRAPAKLEVDGAEPAHPPRKLPSLELDRSASPLPARGTSPATLRLTELKPMPPVQAHRDQRESNDVTLPNAIPSPATKSKAADSEL